MAEDRDYIGEMQAVCTAAIERTEQPNPLVAADIVERLSAEDRDLLLGWLLARAPGIVCDYLRMLDSASRSKARRAVGAQDFAERAKRFEAGETEAFSTWDARFTIDEKGTRRRLGDMTSADHLSQGFGRYTITSWERLT